MSLYPLPLPIRKHPDKEHEPFEIATRILDVLNDATPSVYTQEAALQIAATLLPFRLSAQARLGYIPRSEPPTTALDLETLVAALHENRNGAVQRMRQALGIELQPPPRPTRDDRPDRET
jgi:hypothetical protein